MKKGLCKRTTGNGYFAMRLKCNGASASFSAGALGQMISYFRSTSDDQAIGFLLELGVASGTNYARFDVPSFGISWFSSSIADLELRLAGNVYADEFNNNWYIVNAQAKLFQGGGLVGTWPLGTLTSFFTNKFPSHLPLIGIAPVLYAAGFLPAIAGPRVLGGDSSLYGGPNPAEIYEGPGIADTYFYDGSWEGGWKWVVDGANEIFPTSLVQIAVPSYSCGVSAPGLGTISTTDTWTNTATANGTSVVAGAAVEANYNTAWIQPVPDIPRRYRRLGDDYRANVRRYLLPQARRHGWGVCKVDGVGTPVDTYETAIPERVYIESGITKDPHPFEDALNDVTHCCYNRQGFHFVSPDGFHGTSSERGTEMQGAESPSMAGYIPGLNSTKPLTRYWDFLCNPHQSHKLIFKDLVVQGTSLDANLYETQVREQYLDSLILPVDERTYSRNHVVLDPVLASPLWHESNVEHGARELGLHRWTTYDYQPQVAWNYNSSSSPLFSGTDCTLAFGSDITVTADPGKTNVILDLDLDSWLYPPYQWANLADRIRVNWTTTNIVSIDWYIVGIDGTETPINAIKGVDVAKPRGTATKYAFSFIDNTAGNPIVDLGTDATASGISPATMSDPERAKNFELSPGSTNQKLRARIVLSSAGVACHVNYPLLQRQDGRNPELVYENGKDCAILYQDGAGIRVGNNDWYKPTYPPPTTPTTSGLGLQRSIVDVLCDFSAIFVGIDRTVGLTAKLSALFDSEEASTWLDYLFDTYGIILPDPKWNSIKLAVGNLYSEVPPMALFPRRERNQVTWNEDVGNAWCLDVWSWAPGRKRYIAPGNDPIHVFDGATQKTTTDLVVASGWIHSSHETAVDNQETGWDLKQSGTKFGTAVPWHGYMFVGAASEDGKNLHETMTRPGFLYQVLATKADIHLRRFDLDQMDETTLVYSSSSQKIGIAQVGAFPSTYVRIVFEEDGTVYYVESASFGTEGLWSMPTSIASGKNPAYAIDPKHNIEYVAIYNTGEGKWKMYRNKDGTGFVFVSNIATTVTDDSAAGLELSPNDLGTLVFVYDDAGTIKQTISTNYGESWN